MIYETSTIKDALESLPPSLRSVLRFFTIRPLRAYIRFGPWSRLKLFLYNAFAEHLWWLEGKVSGTTVFGSKLEIDASEIIGKHIYYLGIWEPILTRWIDRRLGRGDLFIDVGANIGYFSLLASKLVGASGKVVAIEALPQIHRKLECNLKQNGAYNVRTVNVAAWDKSEKVKIFSRKDRPSATTTLMGEWADKWQLREELEIEARPLSLILTPEEIQTARLIKIDVEGAEWHIISDMTSWLAQTDEKLEIVLEISRSMLAGQGKSFEDILCIFAAFGFQGYRIRNDYLASTCIREDIESPPQRIMHWPDEPVDQIDLILSRVDADSL